MSKGFSTCLTGKGAAKCASSKGAGACIIVNNTNPCAVACCPTLVIHTLKMTAPWTQTGDVFTGPIGGYGWQHTTLVCSSIKYKGSGLWQATASLSVVVSTLASASCPAITGTGYDAWAPDSDTSSIVTCVSCLQIYNRPDTTSHLFLQSLIQNFSASIGTPTPSSPAFQGTLTWSGSSWVALESSGSVFNTVSILQSDGITYLDGVQLRYSPTSTAGGPGTSNHNTDDIVIAVSGVGFSEWTREGGYWYEPVPMAIDSNLLSGGNLMLQWPAHLQVGYA